MTAENKVNRFGSHYTYYHCSRRRLDYDCRQPYVSVDELEQQVLQFLHEIAIPEQLQAWALARLDRMQRRRATGQAVRGLEQAVDAAARQMDTLTRLRVRDLLTDSEFIRQREKLEHDRIRSRQSLDALDNRSNWFEPRELVLFNNDVASRFETGDSEIRRVILEMVGSNLVLGDRELRIDAKKPFQRWSGTANISDLRGFVEEVRTFFGAANAEGRTLSSALRRLLGENALDPAA